MEEFAEYILNEEDLIAKEEIIYFLAPVDNANNELTKSERKYLRNKVRIFLSSEVVIFVLLLIKANEYWSGIIAISMMIVAILVLAGFIENRIRG